MVERYDPTTGEPWPTEERGKMWLKSFGIMEEEKPRVFWAIFRHEGKPYCAKYKMGENESPYVFEDIADALAHCWDKAWGDVLEEQNEGT